MKRRALSLLLTLVLPTLPAQDRGQKVYAPDPVPVGNFGCSVSLGKAYALIGSRRAYNDVSDQNEAGVAYIARRVDEEWIIHQKFAEPEIDTYDGYGFAVALTETHAVVGAPRTYHGGSAFVYKRTGDLWERQLKLPEYYRSSFGSSASIDGDYIVVGAPDSGGWGPDWMDMGAAYVYERAVYDGTETWEEVTMIAPGDGYENGHFGCDVDISGNHIIAGAWTASADYFGRSAAYIYENEDGNWIEKQRLFPLNQDTTINHFGKCVSISGEIAAVGAPEELNEDVINGAVYIFEKGDEGWQETARLISPDPDTSLFVYFGRSVDIQGQRVLVGAERAVYIFEKKDQAWYLADSIHNDYHNNGQAYHHYGQSLSLSDSTVLVGAEDDEDQASLAGAAHFYDLSFSPVSTLPAETEAGSVRVYPNPVHEALTIRGDHGLKAISIYDAAGRLIWTQTCTRNGSFTREVDFSAFEKGIYVVGTLNQDNEYRTVKIMKY